MYTFFSTFSFSKVKSYERSWVQKGDYNLEKKSFNCDQADLHLSLLLNLESFQLWVSNSQSRLFCQALVKWINNKEYGRQKSTLIVNVKFRNKVPNIFTGPISQKSGLYLFRKFILPICTSHNTRISQVFILEWKYCSLSMCRGPIPRQKVQSIEVCLGRFFHII